MALKDNLLKQAIVLSQRAVDRVMSDQKRANQIASALGRVQRGKAALEKGRDELLRAMSFAPKGEYKAVGKKLASLKRRLRDLEEKLDEIR